MRPVGRRRLGRRNRLMRVTDPIGRFIQFDYSAAGDLTEVREPDVAGTPQGNDFPNGVRWLYTYGNNHLLSTETAPNEAATGGPARLTVTYDNQPTPRVSTLAPACKAALRPSRFPSDADFRSWSSAEPATAMLPIGCAEAWINERPMRQSSRCRRARPAGGRGSEREEP